LEKVSPVSWSDGTLLVFQLPMVCLWHIDLLVLLVSERFVSHWSFNLQLAIGIDSFSSIVA
jgi:hypothetical protein